MNELGQELAYYAAGEEIEITISRADDGVYEETELPLTLGAASDYQG